MCVCVCVWCFFVDDVYYVVPLVNHHHFDGCSFCIYVSFCFYHLHVAHHKYRSWSQVEILQCLIGSLSQIVYSVILYSFIHRRNTSFHLINNLKMVGCWGRISFSFSPNWLNQRLTFKPLRVIYFVGNMSSLSFYSMVKEAQMHGRFPNAPRRAWSTTAPACPMVPWPRRGGRFRRSWVSTRATQDQKNTMENLHVEPKNESLEDGDF